MAGKNPDGDDDFERRWEAITQSLGELEVPTSADEPTDDTGDASRPLGQAEAMDDGWSGDHAIRPPHGPRDYELAPADPGHFEPPDPVITPSGDRWRTAGWIAVLVGAVSALVCVIAHTWIPALWLQLSCGVLVAGMVIVFVRLPARRRDGGDGDDSGARV